MTNEHTDKSIRDSILEKIGAREISMRSKKYFTAQTVLVVGCAALVLLLSAGIVSFILFHIRLSGQGYLLSFGSHGVSLFFRIFPWGLLVLDLALVVLLERLLRTFRFAYRTPAVYLFAGLFFLAALIGFSVDRTPLNDRLLDRADRDGLPQPIGHLYTSFRQGPPPERGLCDCIVLGKEGNVLLARSRFDDDVVKIVLPPESPELAAIKPGERIVVGGEFRGDTLYAFGFQRPGMPRMHP